MYVLKNVEGLILYPGESEFKLDTGIQMFVQKENE